MIEFGTGQQAPFSNTSAATFSTTPQYLMGVWDWNLATWDSIIRLPVRRASPARAVGGAAIRRRTRVREGLDPTPSTDRLLVRCERRRQHRLDLIERRRRYRTVSNSCVGWADNNTGCASSSGEYGWYLGLSTGYSNNNDPKYLTGSSTYNGAQPIDEQVIFNPTF